MLLPMLLPFLAKGVRSDPATMRGGRCSSLTSPPSLVSVTWLKSCDTTILRWLRLSCDELLLVYGHEDLPLRLDEIQLGTRADFRKGATQGRQPQKISNAGSTTDQSAVAVPTIFQG